MFRLLSNNNNNGVWRTVMSRWISVDRSGFLHSFIHSFFSPGLVNAVCCVYLRSISYNVFVP